MFTREATAGAERVTMLADRGEAISRQSMERRRTVVNEDDKGGSRTDRRSILKTAAAAGAVGWTTPLVLSSTVVAACTPKCAPGAFTISFTLERICEGQGDKSLLVTASVTPAALCPCGSGTPTVTLSGANWFDTNNSGTCTGGNALTVTPSGGGFILRKSGGGAVGSGCIYGCVRVTVACTDRSGQPTYRYCDMRVRFQSTPANGSCGERLTEQTGLPTGEVCTNSCTDPGPIIGCP